MTFEGFASDTWEALPGASRLTVAQREAIESDDPLLCVVAGAGAGKTRVLTLRVARRVRDGSIERRPHPGHHLQPQGGRGAAHPPVVARRLGGEGGHVPPHRARPPARAPRAAGAPRPPAAARPPAPAGRRDDRRPPPDPRPRRGDRLGQGPARAAGPLRGRGAPAPAAQRHQPRAGGGRLRPLRGRAGPAAAARLRRPDRRLRRRAGGRQRVRRLHPLAQPSPLRRRDAGRQPGPVPPADRDARPTSPTSSWWATPTSRSTGSTGPTPPCSTGCPRSCAAPRSSAWTRTTAARPRWWPWPRPSCATAATVGEVVPPRTTRVDGPVPTGGGARHRRRRGGLGGRAGQAVAGTGPALVEHRRADPHQRPAGQGAGRHGRGPGAEHDRRRRPGPAQRPAPRGRTAGARTTATNGRR